MSELTINISRLSEGAHQYDFETDAKSLDLDARFTDVVRVGAVLEKTGRQMHLKTDLRTKAHFTCDRCLDEFERDLAPHYEIVYRTETSGTHGNNEEEFQYLSPDASLLDLGEDVRQFLILAVPQKLLCKDDCRGLCPKCGANRNKVACNCAEDATDPRWEALKKMTLK